MGATGNLDDYSQLELTVSGSVLCQGGQVAWLK